MTMLPTNPLLPSKALRPIVVTLLGIYRSPIKFVPPEKAYSPILSSEEPKTSFPLNPSQPAKAFLPIDFTELGINRSPENFLHPLKAPGHFGWEEQRE